MSSSSITTTTTATTTRFVICYRPWVVYYNYYYFQFVAIDAGSRMFLVLGGLCFFYRRVIYTKKKIKTKYTFSHFFSVGK